MRFKDLYEYVEQQEVPPVLFDELAKRVRERHSGVGSVKVWAVKYPVATHQAHYRMVDMDRSSAYDEEYGDVEITYCDALDELSPERRYALTKELMHVFDVGEQLVNDRNKFVTLLKEIQNKPMPVHASAAFGSELDTRWMAAIILFPKKFRDQRIQQYRAGKLLDFDIAEEFWMPEWVVPFVMDDYYDQAFDAIMAA